MTLKIDVKIVSLEVHVSYENSDDGSFGGRIQSLIPEASPDGITLDAAIEALSVMKAKYVM